MTDKPRRNSIRARGLKKHIDLGKSGQHDRGYREFVHYIECGNEFGKALTYQEFMDAFDKSRPTIKGWIGLYCEERGRKYPNKLEELLLANRTAKVK